MGVLARTPPKSTLGALAPPQELADTVGRWGKVSVSPVSPRWGETFPPSLVNRSRGCHPPISVVTRKPPEEWAALMVAGTQSVSLLWGQQEVAPPESRGWPAVTAAMLGSPQLFPLTQKPLTQEWAHPAAPGCAGSSSRARGGWHPDTAGTEGTVREWHWTRQEQAAVRRQPREPPEHRWDERGRTGNAVSTLGLANPKQQTALVTVPGLGGRPSRWLPVADPTFPVPHRLQ